MKILLDTLLSVWDTVRCPEDVRDTLGEACTFYSRCPGGYHRHVLPLATSGAGVGCEDLQPRPVGAQKRQRTCAI